MKQTGIQNSDGAEYKYNKRTFFLVVDVLRDSYCD